MSPIRADFYLTQRTDLIDSMPVIYRILQKAYIANQNVFIWCATSKDARALDEFLWEHKKDRWLPHLLISDELCYESPILIGHTIEKIDTNRSILINLSGQLYPQSKLPFSRIMEIVTLDEAQKKTARTHFRHYQSLGFTCHTHHLEPGKMS